MSQIGEVFAPSTEMINAVRQWLAIHGIGPDRLSISKSSGWIRFNSTVGETEVLLQTKYNVSIACHLTMYQKLTVTRFMTTRRQRSLILRAMIIVFLRMSRPTSTSSRQPSALTHTSRSQGRFALCQNGMLKQLLLSISVSQSSKSWPVLSLHSLLT
jgi:hypothetical protein